MKRNYLTAILNELETIKYQTFKLDGELRKNNHQTDDLAYVLQKLEEVRIFLEPAIKSN